jgi:putative flippase GtrA
LTALAGQWLRFVLGGVINTGFSYLLYLALNLVLPYHYAYFLAYAVGIVFAYWFNSRFVFSVPLSWRGLFSYPLVYVLQYFVSALLLEILIARFSVSQRWAPLCVAAVMLPVTFVMSKIVLVWKRSKTRGSL